MELAYEPQGAGSLTWITTTDKDSRRRAKSHVSREVKRRKASHTADIVRARKEGKSRTLVPAPAKPQVLSGQVRSPISILGAGRVDPFANYPIRLNSNKHLELVDHFMFKAPWLDSKPQKRVCFLPLFQEVRRISFEMAQNDPAAFRVILAIASADISILYDEKVPIEATTHNMYAIRLLTERMSDKSKASLDGTIATVALQVVYQLLFDNCDSLEIHLNALESLVKLRGGMEIIESSNSKLALLINLADYLPPTVALIGQRRYGLSNEVEDFLYAGSISPIALRPPLGLEALAYFDIFIDIKQICHTLQRGTTSILSGDITTYLATEEKLESGLHDLTALGTSSIAWGRRSEILQCVHLASLMYLKTLSAQDDFAIRAEELFFQLSTYFPEPGTPSKDYFNTLLGDLLRSLDGDVGNFACSLAPLMRIGASMKEQTWLNIKETLRGQYDQFYANALQQTAEEPPDPLAEISGLSALFGFFNLE